MGQIPLTNDQRVEALRRFGYTEREAGFLCLAALHGGYFLQRQYARYLGKEAGGTVAVLIEKTLAWQHAKASTYVRNIHVYHLNARPFYAALGQSDNRNRRERQPLTIKNRLMGLDFVLTHPDYDFLATEQEKVDYFTQGLKINATVLPTKVYCSSNNAAPAERFFVDKYPIFRCRESQAPTPSAVSFCFVDEGTSTTSRFETYLDQYRRLFAALPAFQVVYVAARPLLFQAAEQTFRRFATAATGDANVPAAGASVSGRLAYFEARYLYETGHLSSFDRAKVIRLRDQRRTFSEPEHEAAYELWKSGEASAVNGTFANKTPAPGPIHGTFTTYLLEHRYELFGSLTAF
jgi:hypothetical protein